MPFGILLAVAAGAVQTPQTEARARVYRPNVDVHSYRRCYTAGEKLSLSVSLYNARTVELSAYRIRLPDLVRSSRGLEEFGKRSAPLDLAGRRPPATARVTLAPSYPHQRLD